MTTIRELRLHDLFVLNRVIFDSLTAVYPLSYYINKIIGFPELAKVTVAPNEQMVGFVFGHRVSKDDEQVIDPMKNKSNNNRGHVCCLSIDHDFRRIGLGRRLMRGFNDRLNQHRDWYVTLYVRSQNTSAIQLYESLGFVTTRWLPNFYQNNDDGYEMRKPLQRDVDRTCLTMEDFWLESIFNSAAKIFHLLMSYVL
ncbi:hypothetical protein KR222_009683, partial [Zaprionus bogoriensis]